MTKSLYWWNVAPQNIYHGNSDKEAINLWGCVCGREVVGCKIINYPQDQVDAFELNAEK